MVRGFAGRVKPAGLVSSPGAPGKALLHPTDEDLSVGTPVLHPTDEDLSLHPNEQRSLVGDPESVGTPVLHPTDEDLSLHPSEQRSLVGDPESVGTPVLHPTDEDLSLHPSEQRSLVGGPESVGTPVAKLLLSKLWFTHVGKKAGMGRAASGVVGAGLVQAEGSVHRQPDIRGVLVLLAVVLPPANRAQAQRFGRLQRLISATWAAKTSLHSFPQDEWTAIGVAGLHEGRFR